MALALELIITLLCVLINETALSLVFYAQCDEGPHRPKTVRCVLDEPKLAFRDVRHDQMISHLIVELHCGSEVL